MAASPDPAALLAGPAFTWNHGSGRPAAVTFSFATDGLTAFGDRLAASTWAPFSAAQQAAARQALAGWAAVSGLSFVEVPDAPAGAGIDLRFRLEELGSFAIAGATLAAPLGDIALNLTLFRADPLAPSATRIGYATLVHEIGHAIGLKHPFEGTLQLDPAIGTTDVTVMAYAAGRLGQPQGPRALDAAAATLLYGSATQAAAEGAHWSWDAAAGRLRAEGSAGNDTLRGGDHAALLHGSAGDDLILGGAGRETLLLDAPRALAQIDPAAGLASTPSGTDRFSGIEALHLADGTLTLGAEEPAAELLRLYRTALGRAPDASGLADWAGAMAAGLSLHGAAQAFVDSLEFRAALAAAGGTPASLYAANLGTTGGSAGGGADPAATLLDWSESAAARGQTASALAASLWTTDPAAAEVARLYHLALGRAPELAGWQGWVEVLAAGVPPERVAAAFLDSAEFQAGHAGLGAAALAAQLLAAVPGAALAPPSGAPDGAWLLALVESTAARLAFAPVTEAGILFA